MSDASPADARVKVAVALVAHGTRDGLPTYVITQRRAADHLGGAWELPGGKVEAGEAPADAARRELAEELGISVGPLTPITHAHHTYPGRSVLMLFYGARTLPNSATPRPLAAQALRLVTREELLAQEFPPANAGFMSALAATQEPLPWCREPST